MEKVFRKNVVDQLVASEGLDQAVHFIQVKNWIAVLFFTACLGAGLVYSFIVDVPMSVSANGIFWNGKGVVDVVSTGDGVITDIHYSKGDHLGRGKTIITLHQAQLVYEKENLETELNDVLTHIRALEALNAKDQSKRKNFTKNHEKFHQENLQLLEKKIQHLTKREKELQSLKQKGYVQSNVHNAIVKELLETRSRLVQERTSLNQQTRQEHLLEVEREQLLLDKKNNARSIKHRLQLLTAEIQKRSRVLMPETGSILELKVTPGDYVTTGQSIAVVQTGQTQNEDDLTAVLYVPSDKGKLAREGMRVELSPASYPKAENGVIVGSVLKVSPAPSSTHGMMRSLKNDQLVQQLTGNGAPFELVVKLEKQKGNVKNYQWTAESEKPRTINSGMLCSAEVVVKSKSLAELLIPGVDGLLSDEEAL